MDNIEFISYSWKWPNLCRGTLIIKVNEKEYYLNNILNSGGSCRFSDGYSKVCVEHGNWRIYKEDLPEKIRNLKDEIENVVNLNVEHGCCGGCL